MDKEKMHKLRQKRLMNKHTVAEMDKPGVPIEKKEKPVRPCNTKRLPLRGSLDPVFE